MSASTPVGPTPEERRHAALVPWVDEFVPGVAEQDLARTISFGGYELELGPWARAVGRMADDIFPVSRNFEIREAGKPLQVPIV